MVSAIIAFVLKNWKPCLYIAAGLAILLCIRWYGNAQWEKGVAAGDLRTIQRLEAQYKQTWEAEKVHIMAERAAIANEHAANRELAAKLTGERTELERMYQVSKQTLATAVAAAQVRKEDIDAIVKAVPISELDERIRVAARANKATGNTAPVNK